MVARGNRFLSIGLIISSVLVFSYCKQTPATLFPEANHMIGLAGFIALLDDETIVSMSEYFNEDALLEIDSVVVHSSLRAKFSVNNRQLYLKKRNLNVPQYSEVVVWVKGIPYSLMARKVVKGNYSFKFDPGVVRYRNVALKGEMTENELKPMVLVDGIWQITMDLYPGRYPYVFVADRKEFVDPLNPIVVSGEGDMYFSLLEIGSLSDNPRVFASGYRNNFIEFQLVNANTGYFVLWQNFRLPPDNLERNANILQVAIPGDAFKMERSFIRVMVDGKNNNPGNNLTIPLRFGIPVTNPDLLTREELSANILQYIFRNNFNDDNIHVDRFDTETTLPGEISVLADNGMMTGNTLEKLIDNGLFWDAKAVFAYDEESFERLDGSIHKSINRYGIQNMTGKYAGDGIYMGGNFSFQENNDRGGIQSAADDTDFIQNKKLMALLAFALTIPEISFSDIGQAPGVTDPLKAKPELFDNLHLDHIQDKLLFQKLLHVRNSNMAFLYGDFNTLEITDDVYAYARNYFDNKAIVVFNKSDESKHILIGLTPWFRDIKFTAQFGAATEMKNDKLEVRLPPYSFEILCY